MWNALRSDFLNSFIRKKNTFDLATRLLVRTYLQVNTLRKIENGRRLLWKWRGKIHNTIGGWRGRRRRRGEDVDENMEKKSAHLMTAVMQTQWEISPMGWRNQLPFRYTGRWCGSRRMWPQEALPESLPLLTPTDYNKNQKTANFRQSNLKSLSNAYRIPPPHHLKYGVCVGSGVFPAHLQFLSGWILRFNAMQLCLFCRLKRPFFFWMEEGWEEGRGGSEYPLWTYSRIPRDREFGPSQGFYLHKCRHTHTCPVWGSNHDWRVQAP